MKSYRKLKRKFYQKKTFEQKNSERTLREKYKLNITTPRLKDAVLNNIGSNSESLFTSHETSGKRQIF